MTRYTITGTLSRNLGIMTAPRFSEDGLTGGRILIVDDEAINRELFTELLSIQHDAHAVRSGQEALDYLGKHPIDLVILDVMMPVMDGFTVLEKIRQKWEQSDLPVVILSAMAESSYVVQALKLGANDYVTKPITPSVLMARVNTQMMLKALHDERMMYIQQLERAEHLRLQLTRIASHDLKNPLNNLKLAYTLLNELVKDTDPRIKQVLDTVKINVETMHNVIDVFLDMVAIQTNTMTFRREKVALRDIAVNVISQYKLTAEEKDIDIEYDKLKGFVMGDHDRIVQALTNLVSNAIKYSPLNTTIKVWTANKNGMGHIYVKDQGPGIPEEERHLLFEEFAQLSTEPTAGEDSTGLGLWIVREMMHAQEGDVGAYFPDEGGSVFWVAIPLAD